MPARSPAFTLAVLVALTAVAALAMVTVAVGIPGLDGRGHGALATATRPSVPADSPLPVPKPRGTTTSAAFPDFSFAKPPTVIPTAPENQSRLWYAARTWWAAMLEPVSMEFRIFRLDWSTQTWHDTGVLIDDRPKATPDMLWDGRHLYAASNTSASATSGRPRLTRYSYSDKGGWLLDANFPVDLAPAGARSVTVTRDSKGVAWVAYVQAGRVIVNSSRGSDALWGKGIPFGIDGAKVAADDVAAIVAFGPGQVGVLWTNQAEDAIYFAVHRDGDPPDRWTFETVAREAHIADNHMSVKTATYGSEVRVLAVVKTSLDQDPSNNADAPQIILLARTADASWDQSLVTRVRDHGTRPVLQIDDAARVAYVFMTSPTSRGAMYLKTTSLDQISFEAGQGQLVFGDPSDQVSNATGTKQALDARAGLVALAWDDAAGRYLHMIAAPEGTLMPTRPPGTSLKLAPPAAATAVVNDTFDDYPLGATGVGGWAIKSDPRAGRFAVIGQGANRAIRLTTLGTTQEARVCKRVGLLSRGIVTARVRVRVEGLRASDAVITTLRDSLGAAAAVRFGEFGDFAYYNGATKIHTDVAFRRGTWYRSTVTADLRRRTYTWQLRTDAGRLLLNVRGIRFRDQQAVAIRDMCLQTSTGARNLGLTFDDVQVLR